MAKTNLPELLVFILPKRVSLYELNYLENHDEFTLQKWVKASFTDLLKPTETVSLHCTRAEIEVTRYPGEFDVLKNIL